MAEQQPTPLEFPSHFPWPIRIASIDAPAGAQVERGTRLCTYSFTVAPQEGDGKPETRFGTWDSTLKGEVTQWSFKQGQAITAEAGRTQAAVHIKEPCTHPQQWKGMCTTCFADMSQ
jgi:RNA polymerase II subunit A-like phosphatase